MHLRKLSLLGLVILLAYSCANKSREGEIENALKENTVAENELESDFNIEEVKPSSSEETKVEVATNQDQQAQPQVEEQKTQKTEVEVAPTDQLASSQTNFPVEEQKIEAPRAEFTNSIDEYLVEGGETLMLVAFKLYGDYMYWKELKQLNPHLKGKKLSKGTKIKFYVPAQKFVWDPKGLPHLIRVHETLATISRDKYGTDRRWNDIFENNRPMIKNPNLIFAGFTLYYIPDKRDVASE